MSTVSVGMVHGRFQPFHNEQLDYVLSALSRCDQLVVGITNPDSGDYTFTPESDHRHAPASNPFSYYDRCRMVQGALVEAGIDLARVTVVPFHLFDSSKWTHYLPPTTSVVQFVRIFSAWEARKVALLESHGFKVVEIDNGSTKGITSTDVRRLMGEGGNWRALVPAATARIIDDVAGPST